MKIVKVKNIEELTDSKGKHTVCRVKVIMMPKEVEDFRHRYEGVLKTLLVSESEKIENYDWVYDTDKKAIYQFERDENTNEGHVSYCLNKILVWPEDVSNQLLVDGEEVLLECYRRGRNSEGRDADLTGGILIDKNDYYCIRFNTKNHVNILKKVSSKVEDWADIERKFTRDCTRGEVTASARHLLHWLHANDYVIVKK